MTLLGKCNQARLENLETVEGIFKQGGWKWHSDDMQILIDNAHIMIAQLIYGSTILAPNDANAWIWKSLIKGIANVAARIACQIIPSQPKKELLVWWRNLYIFLIHSHLFPASYYSDGAWVISNHWTGCDLNLVISQIRCNFLGILPSDIEISLPDACQKHDKWILLTESVWN